MEKPSNLLPEERSLTSESDKNQSWDNSNIYAVHVNWFNPDTESLHQSMQMYPSYMLALEACTKFGISLMMPVLKGMSRENLRRLTFTSYLEALQRVYSTMQMTEPVIGFFCMRWDQEDLVGEIMRSFGDTVLHSVARRVETQLYGPNAQSLKKLVY